MNRGSEPPAPNLTVVRVAAGDARVVGLIETHVRLMDASTTDPDACHRLGVSGLSADHITVFGAFLDDAHDAVGIGAYAHFGEWGEVKSMHVRADRRGLGISRQVLAAIEAAACERGARILRLETGADFHAAIGLYESAGFAACDAFGGYPAHPFSRFFAKRLAG